MLADLRADYGDCSSWWYPDMPFEQTLQRHATKPGACDRDHDAALPLAGLRDSPDQGQVTLIWT